MEEAYFNERKKQILVIAEDILGHLESDGLSADATPEAAATFARMCERHGYRASSVRVGLVSLLADRYEDVT